MEEKEKEGRGVVYHLVNGLDNLEHLVVANLAVAVNVVQLERPVELVLHLAAARNAQGADELLEVDGARLVRVEHVEDVVGKGRGVAKGEELGVDLLELALGERARRAVFEKAYSVAGVLGIGEDFLVVWGVKGANAPLYHCCSSFLSKLVDFCSSFSWSSGSFLDCLRADRVVSATGSWCFDVRGCLCPPAPPGQGGR